jgi:hypothetical protein
MMESAKKRTVSMPGVDVRPQQSGSRPIVDVDGPTLKRFVLVTEGTRIGETHLTLGGQVTAICGRPGQHDRLGELGKVCLGCRVEASKMRATVR